MRLGYIVQAFPTVTEDVCGFCVLVQGNRPLVLAVGGHVPGSIRRMWTSLWRNGWRLSERPGETLPSYYRKRLQELEGMSEEIFEKNVQVRARCQ